MVDRYLEQYIGNVTKHQYKQSSSNAVKLISKSGLTEFGILSALHARSEGHHLGLGASRMHRM